MRQELPLVLLIVAGLFSTTLGHGRKKDENVTPKVENIIKMCSDYTNQVSADFKVTDSLQQIEC